MGYFKIRLSCLGMVLDGHRQMSSLMGGYSHDVDQVRHSLSMKVRQRSGIDTRLNKAVLDLQEEQRALSRMASAGQSVYMLYQNAERQAVNAAYSPNLKLKTAGLSVSSLASQANGTDGKG